jgi:hypothetical protein
MTRRTLALLAAFAAVALCAVCVVAVVDHTYKHRERVAARRLAWICAHRATDCGGPDPAAIEAAWNRRERIYIGSALVLGAGLVTSLAGALRRRSAA